MGIPNPSGFYVDPIKKPFGKKGFVTATGFKPVTG